uniref:sialic acid-binding Ig-like lectin 15 n=1 Tax=Myxine glutinosa TaxID=7769 RepID=UPI00358EDC66
MIFPIHPALLLIIGSVLVESQTEETNICTSEGTKSLCVSQEVIGLRGEDATLPCLFTHEEESDMIALHVLFYLLTSSNKHYVYNSSSNYMDESFKGRIQPMGNASDGDGSVKIRDLKMEDEGIYICRFEWKTSMMTVDGFQARKGMQTQLRVDVRPEILRIWKESENSTNSEKLFCEAEAKPGPNITWMDPLGRPVELSETMVGPDDPNEIRNIVISLNLTGQEPPGNYTCLAENQYGVVQELFNYEVFRSPSKARHVLWTVLGGIIGAVALAALMAFACKWRRDRAKGSAR